MNERIFTVRTDITNFCNLGCDMCHFGSYSPSNKTRITLEQFKTRFSELGQKTKIILLSCACEPLCATPEEFKSIVNYASKELDIKDIRLITNAVNLNKKFCSQIIESGISQVHISIDSNIKETYEKIRKGAKFERVVSNITWLRDLKVQCKTSFPIIQFNVVLMKSNIEEMENFIDFAQQMGCEQISFFHLIPKKKEHYDEILFPHKKQTNVILDIIREKCKMRKITILDIPENFCLQPLKPEAEANNKTRPRPCRYVNSNDVFITDTADFRPCGFWYNEPPFGNLDRERFQDIWEKADYVLFRNEMKKGIFSKYCCEICPSMGTGDVNDPKTFQVH